MHPPGRPTLQSWAQQIATVKEQKNVDWQYPDDLSVPHEALDEETCQGLRDATQDEDNDNKFYLDNIAQ